MNAFFAAIQRFGVARLAAILGIGIGVAAVLTAISMQFGEPKALLYSNLDLKEAGSITQALDQAGVKYEVKGDGSTIMVGRDEVATTRLLLSSRGLPTAGSVGYEIFDQNNTLGQTDFVQQLNRQRALEGELARTIRSLQGITSARVHLVLPKRQLFEEEAEQPSAAVTIGVGGREPTAEQVRAMQNLVAGAVPNLKPDRVTVVDQNAKTLSGGEVGLAGEADSRKSEVEQRIAKQVKQLVEGVVGAGKSRVNVTADIDLARVTEQSEQFNPDGQVIRSESTSDENASDTQPQPGGQATVGANIPGVGGQNANNTGSQSRNQGTTTNYEISKTVTTRITEPGQVRRLSVAVAVDGVTAPGANGRPGAYTARTADEIQRIDTLVRAAIGYDQARGDQVSVINVRFPTAADDSGVAAPDPLFAFDKNDIMRAAELGVMAIVGLLIVFFVVRPLLRGIVPPAPPRALIAQQTGPQIARMVTMSDGQQVGVGMDGNLALTGPTSELEERIDIARIEGQVKASSVKRVSEFVEKHPDESVAIIRNWLHESS